VKIDGTRADLLNQALNRVGGTTVQAGNRATRDAAPAATTDALQVSDDAKLMQTAMQSVGQTPDIRQDVVERMRAALEKGDIGNDPGVIADALINTWAGTK
jgi:flagellar biosynthesis anti-sigma factor FlgM